MSEEQQRPGQATLAGALIIGGSVFVVLAAWQRVSTLHTLEVQEELQRFLTEPMTGDLGISVDTLATLVRILCLIGAGAATASIILGVQVFKRSASARIALTALSPLLFLGGLATAGFLAPMVLAGIALLWLQPTRDWYAGRPWIQRYEERRAARLGGLRPPNTSAGSPAAPPAPPSAPHATLPTGTQQPIGSVPPMPMPSSEQRPHRGVRPRALVTACSLTWLTSGFVLVVLAVLAAVVPSQSDELYAEMQRQQPQMMKESELGEQDLVVVLYLFLAGLIVWALAAAALAGLAFAGQNWARITLAISGAGAAVVALALSLGAWPLVVLVAAIAGAIWLLLRPEVGRWYTGR
ncbi:hypothetical protein KVF89_20075 [Nocardioides carbamazepini]|uniref:hypothetical protein n=1 Tax=Nocardioides carbamazepini TaxID=2854259 RepID=UPI00214A5657|nr:hypothetical protein [Nocardioides carbamazepini]MCR1784851.1 hypothetical protein [Nocardioides carbamazepini]